MPNVSPEVVGKLAARIGHQLRLEPRRTDYVARCSCGYLSAKRRNAAIALEAAQHHQQLVVRAYEATGRSWPARHAEPEQVFETRSAVVA